jgi:hypothetical protein
MRRVNFECIVCLEATGLSFGGFLFFVSAGEAIFFWALHAGLIVLGSLCGLSVKLFVGGRFAESKRGTRRRVIIFRIH